MSVCFHHQCPFFLGFGSHPVKGLLTDPDPKCINCPEFSLIKKETISLGRSMCTLTWQLCPEPCQHSRLLTSLVQTESTPFRREAIFILIIPLLLISNNIYKVIKRSRYNLPSTWRFIKAEKWTVPLTALQNHTYTYSQVEDNSTYKIWI